MPTSSSLQPLNLELETFKDLALIQLEAKCREWWSRFAREDRPCWLTLCGNCGTGKTHCADRLWKKAKDAGRIEGDESEYLAHKIWWPAFINELRNGSAFEQLNDTVRWPLLYVDEVRVGRDPTGFASEQLITMLSPRSNRWTILTTNLSYQALVDIDTMLASRAIRNDGIVVEVNTVDYYLRKR